MQSIRIVVANRPGLLAEVADCLGQRSISIDHIVVETHASGALVRLELERADDALAALTNAGYAAVSDEVVLARIEDRPGALALLSRRLADSEVNIRSLHHVRRDGEYALVAISTSDNARARELLGDATL